MTMLATDEGALHSFCARIPERDRGRSIRRPSQ